jgi:replicative DNA helicase
VLQDVNEPDNYLIEQLLNDYNQSYLASRFNGIKKLLEADDTAGATKFFLESVEKLHIGSALQCTDIMKDTSRYDRYLDMIANQSKYFISTGFPELDKIITGIDRRNENMVIAARTGVGKSWLLLTIAAAASKQGLTVGIYSGEMSVDKVGYRIDTLLGHINNKAITRGSDYDPSVKLKYKHYIENLHEQRYGPIKVLTPADINGPATVAALDAFVEREKIDILLVDQYSLLEDTSKSKVMHERVANISKDLKNLQVLRKIPIIAVSQMNRTKNEDGEQDSTQIGLSDRIGQDATTIIMLSREVTYSDKEKKQIQDDRLVLNIVKSRDGGNGKLTYSADFNNGIFHYIDTNLSAEKAAELKDEYADENYDYSKYADDGQPF